MSFSIISARPGVFRVAIDGELEGATVGLLRSELVALLGKGPEEVVLGLSRPANLGGAGWGLLQTFLDVLRARGGRVVLELGPDGVVVVRDLPHLMRLLGSVGEPS
jgi:hypothetical protein